MTLEPLPEGALPQVRALLEAASLPVADLESARPEFLALRDATGLLGIVGLEPHGDVALLRSLVVRDDQRGRGVGTRLVRGLEQRAPARGVRELWLLTTTAEAFFRHLGYQPADRAGAPEEIQATAEFRSICPSSAACLRKVLP